LICTSLLLLGCQLRFRFRSQASTINGCPLGKISFRMLFWRKWIIIIFVGSAKVDGLGIFVEEWTIVCIASKYFRFLINLIARLMLSILDKFALVFMLLFILWELTTTFRFSSDCLLTVPHPKTLTRTIFLHLICSFYGSYRKVSFIYSSRFFLLNNGYRLPFWDIAGQWSSWSNCQIWKPSLLNREIWICIRTCYRQFRLFFMETQCAEWY